jgi:uncharacterized protein YxjI
VPRYTIRQKLVAIGKDYSIEDADGVVKWHVDGKVRFATTFVVKLPDGTPLVRARERLLKLEPTIELSRDGAEVGRVRRTSIGDAAPHAFAIELSGHDPMTARGSFFTGSSIRIERDTGWVGDLSLVPNQVVRKAFQLSLATSGDEALMLSAAMCLVSMVSYRGEHLG